MMLSVRPRSPSEIAFRLRQEARNLGLLLKPPSLPGEIVPRAPFPDPEPALATLRSTSAAESILATADRALEHRFPLLGLEIETGPDIRWRRDYLNQKETAADYFRRIPYLDAASGALADSS